MTSLSLTSTPMRYASLSTRPTASTREPRFGARLPLHIAAEQPDHVNRQSQPTGILKRLGFPQSPRNQHLLFRLSEVAALVFVLGYVFFHTGSSDIPSAPHPTPEQSTALSDEAVETEPVRTEAERQQCMKEGLLQQHHNNAIDIIDLLNNTATFQMVKDTVTQACE